MSVTFESKEAAEELNSHCAFCGLLKFYTEYVDGLYRLIRCWDKSCEEHCQFNHSSEVVYRPVGEHDDTMMIVRGG